MIERTLLEKLIQQSKVFPVVSLTGVRQSGKSTLLKHCFPNYTYVSLEAPDIRQFALEDPRGFLQNYGTHLILDEVQTAPELFSYIQPIVDESNESGMFILSGSQNFLLMEKITQSLAGRTAILRMSPLSISELRIAKLLPENLNLMMFTGGYPRIYDKDIPPYDYFPSYLQTYIERDVRELRNIGNRMQFVKFLRLCAGRAGQLLNITSFANEADISVPTLKSWLSILETSGVIFFLPPYYRNFNKRLVKSPKLYFLDTGLLCSLLGIRVEDQLATHYMRGEIFENLIISERVKNIQNQGVEPQLFFWRDSNGNEVDLLEDGEHLIAYEIKSAATLRPEFFKGLNSFSKITGNTILDYAVVYGGNENVSTSYGNFISWKNW